MIVYDIHSVNVIEILKDLAHEMKANLNSAFGEYTLNVPDHLGAGKVEGIEFSKGIGLFKINVVLKKQLIIHLKSKKVHPLKLFYSLEGDFKHSMKPGDQWLRIHELQGAILGSHFKLGHIYNLPVQQKICFYFIEVDRTTFLKELNYKAQELPYYFYKLFADVQGVYPFSFKGKPSLKIAKVFKQMESFEGKGMVRMNFLEAKVLEIFSLMLAQFEAHQFEAEESIGLRNHELKLIHQIANHIQENYANFQNIDEISREFGLSKSKIQQGFQQEYGYTVNEYLNDVRLENSIRLMKEGDKNISEIVYAIGLSSRSYFSKIFKEKFKVLPSIYLKEFEK